MRYLLFETRHTDGPRRWAIPVTGIVEVVPMVTHRPVEGGPLGALGLFDFHGSWLPLVDLSIVFGGAASLPTAGSRIVVVDLGSGAAGLLVEGILALDTIDFDAAGAHAGLDPDGTAPGGRVARWRGSAVQEVRIDRLASDELASLVGGDMP